MKFISYVRLVTHWMSGGCDEIYSLISTMGKCQTSVQSRQMNFKLIFIRIYNELFFELNIFFLLKF